MARAHEPEHEQAASEAACELCKRTHISLTRHHLIPQSRHDKARTERLFNRTEMKNQIALLCRPCHSQVHAILDNTTLGQRYTTVEALLDHPDIARFADWVRKKPSGLRVSVRRKRS